MRGPPEPLTAKDLLRRFLAPAVFVALVFSVYFRTTDAPEPPLAQEDAGASGAAVEEDVLLLEGETMGTRFSVKVVGSVEADAQQAILDAVQTELARVDEQMSTWRDDSELSRFNRHQDGTPFTVSPETRAVVEAAAAIWKASDGAFDPTVGPLVRAWGFGGGDRPESVLDDSEIEALLAHAGMQRIAVGPDVALTKTDAATELDLSAIAKGWGVDRVHGAVTALGHRDVMVEIGGEVRVSGRNARGERWRLGVERPDAQRGTVQQVVLLDDEAMATSGDYRNYVERDGTRWSHTIDPRTGRPITHGLASVTVLAADCMTADAWATALNVLGPEVGLAVADAEGLKAYFLVRTGDGFEPRRSAALAASDRLPVP